MDSKNFDSALKLVTAARQLDPNNPELQEQFVTYQELAKKNVDLNKQGIRVLQVFKDVYLGLLQLSGSAPSPAEVNLDPIPFSVATNQRAMITPASGKWESRQLRSAYRKMSIGDYVGAENILANVLRENSGNWTAHALIAKSLLNQPNPDYEGASMEAKRALNIHGNDPDMLNVLAGALVHLVKSEIAVNELRQYLGGRANESKRVAEAHFIVSQAYRRAGQHQEELKNLSEAASFDPPQFSKLYDEALDAYGRQTGAQPVNRSAYPWWRWLFGALLCLGGIVVLSGQLSRREVAPLAVREPAQDGSKLASPKAANRGAPASMPMSWNPGSRLNDNFDVVRVLGQGGMGEVYLAFDKSLGRNVAIKRMRPGISQIRKERERFLREARSVSKLDRHPNIVRIHHILEMPTELGLVFEYVEGETLSQILERKHRLSFTQAMEYLKPVCSALDFAHRSALIHRDLKPSNIMLSKDGVVKVMDFGIARDAKNALTALTNTIVGTPPYMAPEMEMGLVGKEGDIFSLGVTLYELLSGETPFAGASAQHDKKNMNFRPLSSFVPGLPLGIDEFIAHALQPDPACRIESADRFSAGLARLSLAPKAPFVRRRGRSGIRGVTPPHGTA